jgi:SAM-dependent methyltransferase
LFIHCNDQGRRLTEQKANQFLEIYHLQSLYEDSTADDYRENLFYLEMLERALATVIGLPGRVAAADIGSSHWFYVHVLYSLLKWGQNPPPGGRQVSLSGYEADAYRVYANFHSRYDYAVAQMRNLEGVNYIPLRFTPQPAAFDLVTMLFPFVFLSDHLAWGLPRHQFAPEILLTDAWSSLNPGGVLVIVNQGEKEHQVQLEMLAALSLNPVATFRHDSLFYQYDLPRYVLVTRYETH